MGFTPWVRHTPERAMNAKLRRAGFAARGLDDAAICQVAADDSDGFISEDTVEMLAVAHKERKWRPLVTVLVTEGRWEAAERGGEAGWLVHDYEEFNFTKAYWQAAKEKKRAAGSKGGSSRTPHGEASAQASAKASAQASAPLESVKTDEAKAKPLRFASYINPPYPPLTDPQPPPAKDEQQRPYDRLYERWINGLPQRRRYRRDEWTLTRNILEHVRHYLDETAIDERIGYCQAHSEGDIGTTRYLLISCQQWAKANLTPEHHIPDLPAELDPTTKRSGLRVVPNEPSIGGAA